ncbi:MAG: segregation/condensation protein A [Planctomycetaceae bacterium]
MPDYRVQLDLYAGPLDLLLYLVRRSELDVLELQIARITSQFVEFLEVLEFLDLDQVGEFLVTAGTLLEIKSRLVLPQPEEEAEAEIEDEPRGDLIQRLLEYKRFKEAAIALEERAALWQDRFPRLSDERPRQEKDPAADRIRQVELWDLVGALARVLRTRTIEREHSVRHEEEPIAAHVARIAARVRAEGRMPFSAFFDGTNRRGRIVAIFLAVLELLRHHAFRAEQPVDGGEIWVMPPLPGCERSPLDDGPADK